jgi:hypothetical protein
MSRSTLKSFELVRLEDLYYKSKKIGGDEEYCKCSPLEANFTREGLIKKLFKGNY